MSNAQNQYVIPNQQNNKKRVKYVNKSQNGKEFRLQALVDSVLWDIWTLTIFILFSFIFLILLSVFLFYFILKDDKEACDKEVTWQVT